MMITMVWSRELKINETPIILENAFKMMEIARDAWPASWMPTGTVGDRNEITLEIPNLGALLDRISGIKRVFASFGITPEIEVDGAPLLAFAWRQQVEKIHCVGLINQAIRELRRGYADDQKGAIRVALQDGLNKPFAETERELLADP